MSKHNPGVVSQDLIEPLPRLSGVPRPEWFSGYSILYLVGALPYSETPYHHLQQQQLLKFFTVSDGLRKRTVLKPPICNLLNTDMQFRSRD